MKRYNKIVAIEVGGSALLIGAELLMRQYSHLFHFVTNVALLVLLVAPLLYFSRKLVKEIIYLEEMIHMCAWCKRIKSEDEWLSLEEYIVTHAVKKTTHGVCPECHKKVLEEIG